MKTDQSKNQFFCVLHPNNQWVKLPKTLSNENISILKHLILQNQSLDWLDEGLKEKLSSWNSTSPSKLSFFVALDFWEIWKFPN